MGKLISENAALHILSFTNIMGGHVTSRRKERFGFGIFTYYCFLSLSRKSVKYCGKGEDNVRVCCVRGWVKEMK